MIRTITLRISGRGPETDAPSVDDLSDQLRDYFDLLEIVEKTVAEDNENAIVWRVVHATTASPIAFTIQAFPRQFAVNVDVRADHVVTRTLFGLQLLEQKAEAPPYFTEKALEKAETIFERVTNGLDRTDIEFKGFGENGSFILTPSIARGAVKNVRAILEPEFRPYKEIGSIEGYFQSVGRDGHGRRLLYMKSRTTGDEVKCIVTGEAEKALERCEIADIWRKRRLAVYGTIHFKGPGRVSHIEGSRIRFFRSRSELPDVDDIIDPNFTGGLRSEDYLEKLRNGDLS